MAKGFKSIVEGKNPEVVIDMGSDVVLARHNSEPEDGATGTLAGIAGPGSLLLATTGALYQNTGTKASPTWTALGAAA